MNESLRTMLQNASPAAWQMIASITRPSRHAGQWYQIHHKHNVTGHQHYRDRRRKAVARAHRR